MKRRIVHLLQKYVLNPQIKFFFLIGIVPPGYALLETTGRKTGKPRRTPVGNGRVGREFWIVAEHGENAASQPLGESPRAGEGTRGPAVPLVYRYGPYALRGRSPRAPTLAGKPVARQQEQRRRSSFFQARNCCRFELISMSKW